MVIIRRKLIGTAGRGVSPSQFVEPDETAVPRTTLMNPKFPPASGLTISGTVQTSPEWYESLQRTVEFIVDQRIQQTLPALNQMVNELIEAKIMEGQLPPIQIVENALDLTKEQIKNLILKEINIGQIFYPSDIANKFGLDLMVVMDTIKELTKEGKLKHAGNVNVSSS